MFRFVIFLSTLLLFTACSPRYIVKTHYTNPSGSQAKQCLQGCEAKRTTCQHSCDLQYDNCMMKAEENAKDNLPLLLSEYERELDDYYYEFEQYERDLNRWERKQERLRDDQQYYRDRCKKDKKGSPSCSEAHNIKERLSSMYSSKPYEPYRPNKPTLDEEIKKFQKNCSRECGCTKSYDNCFVTCGGKLHYEKICVENCK